MRQKKLSDTDVKAIYESPDPPAVLAKLYPVTEWYIYEIKAGRARNNGDRPVKQARHMNTKGNLNLFGLGVCQVCGIKLHRGNLTTDGNGYELEICDNGHRVPRA